MGMVIPEVGVVAEAMAGLEYLAHWEVDVVAEAIPGLAYRLMGVFRGAIALYTAVLCWGVGKYIAVLLVSS